MDKIPKDFMSTKDTYYAALILRAHMSSKSDIYLY